MRGQRQDRVAEVRDALAGRYEIESAIGRGAMATVYAARDLREARPVAVKVLHPELGLSLASGRFQREIRFLSTLDHPNIVPLLDSGEVRGLFYFVMPCFSGETLRHRLERERRLPLKAAAAVLRHVAPAVDYAHEHNVVHRDLKPENILLEGGQALICDFGLARAIILSGDAEASAGLPAGSAFYMSPEQIRPEESVDGRADIYALGCVLYEMLAGRPPFSGPSAQVILARHVNDPPPPLRTLRPDLPDSIERAIFAALAKNREARPQSAARLLESIAGR